MTTDHMFMDHEDGDTACLLDPKHTAALYRRKLAGPPAWSPMELRHESGDWRHYLDGQAIHCGSALELQGTEHRSDDYGEYSIHAATGVVVRYETARVPRRADDDDDGPPWRAVLYADVGGYSFTTAAEPWMRFRWPARKK